MSCCDNDIVTFNDEANTIIPYTGTTPIVQVYYEQPGGTYQEAGIFTQVQITATDIIVNHGGLATGYVKIL